MSALTNPPAKPVSSFMNLDEKIKVWPSVAVDNLNYFLSMKKIFLPLYLAWQSMNSCFLSIEFIASFLSTEKNNEVAKMSETYAVKSVKIFSCFRRNLEVRYYFPKLSGEKSS